MSRHHALRLVACLLALAAGGAAAARGLQQQAGTCPLPQAVIDQLNFASVSQPCAVGADRDAFCRACICAVGDAIVSGLQAQGLTLEALAAQAQQELAGRDLPTVARQVLADCQMPVALRVVATSQVDSAAFNTLQLCQAEQVAQGCEFTRAINETVQRAGLGGAAGAAGLPIVADINATALAANVSEALGANATAPAAGTTTSAAEAPAVLEEEARPQDGPEDGAVAGGEQPGSPSPAADGGPAPAAATRNGAGSRAGAAGAAGAAAGAAMLALLAAW